MRNLSLGRRHLVNAYEVKAGIGVIAGNTVCVIHAWAPWVWYTTKSVLYKYTYLYLLPLPMHEWRPCCRSGRALRDTAASVILACANPPPSGLPHLHLQLFCPRLRPDRSTASASTAVLSTAAARPVYHICIYSCSVDGCGQTGQDDVHQYTAHRPTSPPSSHRLYNFYDLFWHLIFLNLHVLFTNLY